MTDSATTSARKGRIKALRRDGRGGSAAAARHLTPWKKGQSGNPNKISSGRRMSDEIRALLDTEIPDFILAQFNVVRKRDRVDLLAPGTTFRQAVAARLVLLAIDGSVAAIREVADRDEGRPAQHLDVTAGETREITIRIIEERVPALEAGDDEDAGQVINVQASQDTLHSADGVL